MNAYLDESDKALKARPADDEPTRRGPPAGHDPHPLTSAKGGADPAGPRSTLEQPRPPTHGEPTRAIGGVESSSLVLVN